MRSHVDLSVLVTDDAEQRQRRLDEEFTLDDSDATSIALQSGNDYNLAASAAAIPVSFGGVTTTSLILIVAFDEIQIQLGSNTAPLITIPPVPAVSGGALSTAQKSQQPGVVYMRARVGSIFLTNPSNALVARAFVAVAGV